MHLRYRVFYTQKDGNHPLEYEDAFAPKPGRPRIMPACFAIADGATESAFSKIWAQLLVSAVYDHPELLVSQQCSAANWETILATYRDMWLHAISDIHIPWYLEEKVYHGAYSTLLGVQFSSIRDYGQWKAAAIGDCNLFHIREYKNQHLFPLMHSRDFNNTPNLICSRTKREGLPSIQYTTGRFRLYDSFYLMTDALAKWFLIQSENQTSLEKSIAMLEQLEDKDVFLSWITELRHKKELRNDDVTFIRINSVK